MTNIYQSSIKESFLQEVTDFICKNFANDFSKLKIILPSGLICNELQKTLIDRFKTTMLPRILPIAGLVAEGEEIFQIPSEQIGMVDKLEEKIILAEIIHSYEKLNYSLSQSLSLSSSLANLFFDFETNNITIQNLKDLPLLDQAQHWNSIYDFLCYASNNWQKNIAKCNKLTRAAYQKLSFNAELERLKNNEQESLLLAGITGNNFISNKFIANAVKLNNTYLILPPTANYDEDSIFSKEYLPEDALYQIYKLLNLIYTQDTKITQLGVTTPSVFDNLIRPTSNKSINHNIDYIEFENIFHEAEYIAIKCTEIKNKKTAIIVHSQQAKEQYCTYLDKYNLPYNDLLGLDVIKQPVISIMLLTAKYLCSEFSIKNLFALLLHPLLHSSKATELQNLVRTKNRLVSTKDGMSTLVEQYADNDLNAYYQKICHILNVGNKTNNFSHLLKQTIKALEGLKPEIWQLNPNITNLLAQIVQINWEVKFKDKKDFPELLKQIIEGGRLSNTNYNANITICRMHEAALINYDLVIITDLNEDVYPAALHNSPWLNHHMQKELKLDSTEANRGSALYNFYLNLQNKNLLLTRAQKKNGNKTLLPSPFIQHLMHIFGNKLQGKVAMPKEHLSKPVNRNIDVSSSSFPKQISATDIEILMRSPYNFYAKKILNLRKINEINDQPNLAEFGNFFHLVAEKYTKNYNAKEADKISTFTMIASSLLEENNISLNSKKSWMVKLSAIAEEFIEFDEERRKTSNQIYSEVKGNLELIIAGQKINIVAIADRIEIDNNNIATIIDYKTGVLPSKKDMLSGLSPQLIIEAMILLNGGFSKTITHTANQQDSFISSEQEIDLTYVKINSSKPYINTMTITLTSQEITEHQQGLISMLEHYITNKKFIIDFNIIKYDDYYHLARRQ